MATQKIIDPKDPSVKGLYNPSKTEKEHTRRVYDDFYTVKMVRSSKDALWDKADKTYETLRPSRGSDDWQSNIIPPMTTAIVESILADMADVTLRPKVEPVGREDEVKSDAMNHILNYTWNIGRGDIESFKTYKDALIYGTGIAQEYYVNDKRVIQELIKFDPEKGIEEYKDRTISDFDDVYLESINIRDFYVDPKATSMQGPTGAARYAIRRSVMDIEEFRRVFSGPIWNPLDHVKFVKPGGDTSNVEFFKPTDDIDKRKDVEVLWYWSKTPSDALIVIANGVIVRMGPNPYNHKQLPFARAVDVMRSHSFYGKGEPELIESLQEELTLLRRMRIDQNRLALWKPFLVSDRENLDESELIVRPGGPIHVNDVELGIKELAISEPNRASYLEEDRIKEDIIRTTGIDDRFQSVQSASTATEAAILKESTLKHIRLKLWTLQRTFMAEIAKMRVSNIQQFYAKPKLEKIVGDADSEVFKQAVIDAGARGSLMTLDGEPFESTFRSIRAEGQEIGFDNKTNEVTRKQKKGFSFFEARPEIINGSFDISFSGAAEIPISKTLKQQNMRELLQNPIITLAIESGAYDVAKLADKLLETHDVNLDDVKVKGQDEGPGVVEQLIELASIENSSMVKGEEIGGTPYSNSAHTQVHLEFMKSDDFTNLDNDDPVIQIFTNHIMQEILAQAQRQQGGGQPGQSGQPSQAGPAATGTNQALPSKLTGGSPEVVANEVNPPPGK